jgi:hypothetical protein
MVIVHRAKRKKLVPKLGPPVELLTPRIRMDKRGYRNYALIPPQAKLLPSLLVSPPLCRTATLHRARLSRTHNCKLTLAGNGDVVTQLAGLSVDLDPVLQELLERSRVEDVVRSRDAVVDVELVQRLAGGGLGSGAGGFGLQEVSVNVSGVRSRVPGRTFAWMLSGG